MKFVFGLLLMAFICRVKAETETDTLLRALLDVLEERQGSECYTDLRGRDYRGSVRRTKSGATCQKWTAQSPNQHEVTPRNYPNKGLGNHNKCRNPDNTIGGAWCFTVNGRQPWEHCNIGQPKKSCP